MNLKQWEHYLRLVIFERIILFRHYSHIRESPADVHIYRQSDTLLLAGLTVGDGKPCLRGHSQFLFCFSIMFHMCEHVETKLK